MIYEALFDELNIIYLNWREQVAYYRWRILFCYKFIQLFVWPTGF